MQPLTQSPNPLSLRRERSAFLMEGPRKSVSFELRLLQNVNRKYIRHMLSCQNLSTPASASWVEECAPNIESIADFLRDIEPWAHWNIEPYWTQMMKDVLIPYIYMYLLYTIYIYRSATLSQEISWLCSWHWAFTPFRVGASTRPVEFATESESIESNIGDWKHSSYPSIVDD